ncbi:MAG: glutamate synthase-related protein [Caulobacteraceae bacterium]
MRESLLFVHNTLVGAGLRERIKLGVAGKIVSAFDIASVLAIGADWANAARGFMFAVGCVQSRTCNTNRCPTGVATQDALRQGALVVTDKAERVYNFHRLTLRALSEMLGRRRARPPGPAGSPPPGSPGQRHGDPAVQPTARLPEARRTAGRRLQRRLLRRELEARVGGHVRRLTTGRRKSSAPIAANRPLRL